MQQTLNVTIKEETCLINSIKFAVCKKKIENHPIFIIGCSVFSGNYYCAVNGLNPQMCIVVFNFLDPDS